MSKPFTPTQLAAMPAEEVYVRLCTYFEICLPSGVAAPTWYGPLADRYRDFIRWILGENPPHTTAICGFTFSSQPILDIDTGAAEFSLTRTGGETDLQLGRRVLTAINDATEVS